MKKKIKIPYFKNEDRERAFWSKIDLNHYFKKGDFEAIHFPNLKPTSRSISIRLPEFLLTRVKEEANELDVPYQSLIKKYIAQGVIQVKK